MATLKEGDRVSNYLLEAQIGAGSFGEVWRAKHHIFDERVAIKIPTDAQYVRNLQREGVVVHGLRHENIVRAIDLDPYGSPPYLVMELVDGPALREVIDHYGKSIPIPAAVEIMIGMLHALRAAHGGGLIHRDIKPANVLLNHPLDQIDSVTREAVKVTDFGLGQVGGQTAQSMMQSGSLMTEDGRSVAGTLAYMSPEHKEGQPADERSDLYSCGIVLFEMLTGERPQGGDLPSSVRREVPGALDEVFRRCYTRHDRRFASAEQMLASLPEPSTLVAGGIVPPPPPAGGAVTEPPQGLTPPTFSPAPSSQGQGPHREPVGGKCPKCWSRVQADDQFCITCGMQLVESVPRCSACGGFVHRNDRYCIFCGKDLQVLSGKS